MAFCNFIKIREQSGKTNLAYITVSLTISMVVRKVVVPLLSENVNFVTLRMAIASICTSLIFMALFSLSIFVNM